MSRHVSSLDANLVLFYLGLVSRKLLWPIRPADEIYNAKLRS
jgi:hypothetical protein